VTSLDYFAALGRKEQGLAVVSTVRADGTVQSSLVNAGMMPHPITGEPSFAFVTYGKVKLANLRRRPQLTATVRSGWRWASVEGLAEIIGPDDPHPSIDGERLRLLLGEAFTGAGGTHGNWAEYDRVMAGGARSCSSCPPGSTATPDRSSTSARVAAPRRQTASRQSWTGYDRHLK
jgi:PPOX class probable F420-dependent enzyme